MKILVAESIAQEGTELLRQHAEVLVKPGLKPEELKEIIGDFDALVVRSQTHVSEEIIEAGEKLKVIGRAGVGTDNIDVDAATRKGKVVVNAPTANTVSAAEHTIALMLALARHIPQANNQLQSGTWARGKFMGTELRNKTLGIIGLGNVGSEVAKRAQAFEMRVIAHDPLLSSDYARKLRVDLVSLEQLLEKADFITLHVPSTPATKKLIGVKELAKLKPSAQIINCARGGLVDEKALAKAVKDGRIAGAAFDVFEDEPATDSPLFGIDKIIVTPHLGASTIEAQANIAREIAEQVLLVLQGQFSQYAVNAPHTSPELMPFIKAASTMGSLVSQLIEGQMKSLHIKYSGEIVNYDCSPLKAAAISGLLQHVVEEKVNLINAPLIAAKRGLKISEESEPTCENYSTLITLSVKSNEKTTTVSATVMRNQTHLVQIDDFWMDIAPVEGYFLFCSHRDRPGLIGSIGTITGKANIDISSMHLSRLQPAGQALVILALDEPLNEEQQQEVLALYDVYNTKTVQL